MEDDSSDNFVAPVIHISETEPVVTVETRGCKRSLDEIEFVLVDDSALGLDHDYFSKKPRHEPEQVVVDPFEEGSFSPAPKPQRSVEEKYRDRRIKNNIASRRSREIRKMKYSEMEGEAERLIGENERLREKIRLMEEMAKEMKASLINKIAGKEWN